jgi:hypothetical protein
MSAFLVLGLAPKRGKFNNGGFTNYGLYQIILELTISEKVKRGNVIGG